MADGVVYNAVDGCKKLGIDGTQMDKQWVRRAAKAPARAHPAFGTAIMARGQAPNAETRPAYC